MVFMTVIVTCNVSPRFRGFLASCMLEIAAGVYTSPRMNKGIRDRVWAVIEAWYSEELAGFIVMTWQDSSLKGGQEIKALGTPSQELFEYDELFLVRKALSEPPPGDKRSLTNQ
ncbi:MAG: type I-E CRISPR-associated endoribonuclease Cas2 [Candidatus Riflebacteria bacterium]|nr:type I-E CRISPR-associated endoribonuclease Cas2 [Candidatus Riflebacteria bacterium]